MIKWIALGAIILIATVFVIKIIKTMLKIEKQSNKKGKADKESAKDIATAPKEEYVPEKGAIDLNSSSNTIMTDMSVDSGLKEDGQDYYQPSGFTDSVDDEFKDYSAHARKHSKGRRRQAPDDFDLDGDFADEFTEDIPYIPASPEFGYLRGGSKPKRQPLKKELQDMPTELKVLMLSDIFDRKFFD